ncbi:ABC transporter ATP-binding protein [Nocardioides sp. T2.26MG-1]|uniref:ABC transporter ATP-binding protein n=1 Tax=Nocardioides sp. T2.26MG-1 TaxID=3041166 RepID=UPI002477B7CB|nr:ABC transporter ATP-binding protein [Nocardioides sp. T2.26MG-1]CAI9419420.1 Spermidine/putrescine import ATP-binding protein PotA [Nocardioides sp. T2.26MG-1]
MAENEADAGKDLRLERLTKRFGDFVAVDDLTLTVPRGSFFALLGPSGCGKTTTLRMVAGLEDPSAGRVLIGDQDITHLRPYKRPVNTVFQSYALFPHLSIFENVAFGLRRRGVKDYQQKTRDMLELVQLGPYGDRKPAQLSGGQQQRVALGRALINEPGVLLLDEPLGALDLKLRRQMQIELKRIQTEIDVTFVHVTHDQEEAMTMADTIAVMNHGVIEQMGAPADLYENPVTTFVANFLGQSNLIKTNVIGTSGGEIVLDCHGQKLAVAAARSHADGRSAWLGVRPEKIYASVAGVEDRTDADVLTGGRVTDVSFIGVSTQYLVAMPWGQELMVFEQNTGSRPSFRNGDEVDLMWAPDHAFLLDADQDAHAGMMRPEDRE